MTIDEMTQHEWKNLAPDLCRQRIMIEGTTIEIVEPPAIADYLKQLSTVLKMQPLREPFAYQADELGYGGWIHWRTSGAHFYSYPRYEAARRLPLFSVDAYTCKPFSMQAAAEFTRDYFKPIEMVWKDINV
ncbi:hypothetical protein HYS47_01580 [Candidatus Woesearchaeota archaeon]|nr:hypothetical protein [Candidatus Woesearchaeota archaeon]